MKICKKCGLPKELAEFRVDRGYVRGECRACERKARKKYYDLNSEKACASARKWSKDNPEHRNAIKRNWNHRNPEKVAAYHRKTSYGIPAELFKEMLDKQNNSCAICRLAFEKTNRVNTPHVDHAHDGTKQIRGLLCGNCNSGIGKLGDDFSTVIKAASYLRNFLS
jgi:hypothetical protein